MPAITAEWVSKADEDYHLARLAMSAGEVPLRAGACFHAQQCAEKYLKAFLIEHDKEAPRIHVLSALLELCLPLDATLKTLRADCVSLEGYAVAARYPGVRLTDAMAVEALAAMKNIRAFMRAKLNLT